MKLIHKHVEKDGKGTVTMIPDDDEDMWHLYNLISEGDSVRASTVRKVMNESVTGSTTSNRVRTVLTISVEAIDFDTQVCVLRLKGRNIQENDYVKMGAYHTLDIELNRKCSLCKEEWDCIALDRIEMACDPSRTADAAAIVMQEGIAHICLITTNMTIVRGKVEVNIPRKGRGHSKQHEKELLKFFDMVMHSMLRHINFNVVKVLLIASPGFVKDQFKEYILKEAFTKDNKVIMDNKSKFLLVSSSSGFKHSLKDVLADPAVTARMADTKALEEAKTLQAFYTLLSTDCSRAFYGVKHVELANENAAIDTLLILDSILRSKDVKERKRYAKLIDSVKNNGGTVKVFSSLHISGEQLGNMTGIAAILRFPLAELEEEELGVEMVTQETVTEKPKKKKK